MLDNGDGTYNYDYTTDVDGVVTIFVYKLTGIYVEKYGCADFSCSFTTETLTILDKTWAGSDFPSGTTDNISAKFYFNLVANTTEQYTFIFNGDDDTIM